MRTERKRRGTYRVHTVCASRGSNAEQVKAHSIARKQQHLEVRSYSYFSRLVQLSNIYCIVFSWYQKRECTFIFAISAVTGERNARHGHGPALTSRKNPTAQLATLRPGRRRAGVQGALHGRGERQPGTRRHRALARAGSHSGSRRAGRDSAATPAGRGYASGPGCQYGGRLHGARPAGSTQARCPQGRSTADKGRGPLRAHN